MVCVCHMSSGRKFAYANRLAQTFNYSGQSSDLHSTQYRRKCKIHARARANELSYRMKTSPPPQRTQLHGTCSATKQAQTQTQTYSDQRIWTWEAEGYKSNLIIFDVIYHFFFKFQDLSVAYCLSLNTVPPRLDHELNSSKSHTEKYDVSSQIQNLPYILMSLRARYKVTIAQPSCHWMSGL